MWHDIAKGMPPVTVLTIKASADSWQHWLKAVGTLRAEAGIDESNGQALVDSKRQVIVHAKAFGTGHDHNLVPPMLSGAMENLEKIGLTRDYFKGTMFAADSGYHSKVNIQRSMDEEIDAYISDRRFHTRDPLFKGRKGQSFRTHYRLQDFRYNEENNQYECPKGKMLSQKVKSHRCTGVIYRVYGAQEQDCQGCTVRSKCLYGDGCGPRSLSVPLDSFTEDCNR